MRKRWPVGPDKKMGDGEIERDIFCLVFSSVP